MVFEKPKFFTASKTFTQVVNVLDLMVNQGRNRKQRTKRASLEIVKGKDDAETVHSSPRPFSHEIDLSLSAPVACTVLGSLFPVIAYSGHHVEFEVFERSNKASFVLRHIP